MLQATGIYKRTWTGRAQENLKSQIPLIQPYYPEIANYYPATINVQFESKILVVGYELRTPPIYWETKTEGEVFDLLRVQLRFPDLSLKVTALMYVAHWSVHRNDPHKHEFLAEYFIENLQDTMTIILECNRDYIELPYTAAEKGLDGTIRKAHTLVIC